MDPCRWSRRSLLPSPTFPELAMLATQPSGWMAAANQPSLTCYPAESWLAAANRAKYPARSPRSLAGSSDPRWPRHWGHACTTPSQVLAIVVRSCRTTGTAPCREEGSCGSEEFPNTLGEAYDHTPKDTRNPGPSRLQKCGPQSPRSTPGTRHQPLPRRPPPPSPRWLRDRSSKRSNAEQRT